MLCIVLTLKATAGPIEFEAFGFKFRGASGPMIFWLITFFGFIAAVKVLWKYGFGRTKVAVFTSANSSGVCAR